MGATCGAGSAYLPGAPVITLSFWWVTKCQKCQALGDFNYHDDNNYLQIEEGDIIDIIDFEESDWILGQKGNIKGLVPKSHVRLLKHQPGPLSDLQIYSDFKPHSEDYINIENELTPEDSTFMPPPLPARRKCRTPQIKNRLQDIVLDTYGNDDQLYYSSATLPPLPVRQKCQTLPTKNLLLDTTENTYGNDDWLFETMNDKCKNEVDKKKLDAPCPENHYIQDKPPVLPKRQRKIQQNNEQSLNPMEFTYENVTENSNDKPPVLPKRPTKIHLNKVQSLNPIESTYGNMSEYSYGKRDKNEIRFVMVGRTGSGKSATGNTIMAKADHFESRLAGGSVTRECQRGECIQAGRNIVLVDTPGLFDSQVSSEQTWKEIIRCVNMSTPGPHAFLIVIQIARFTDEEIEKFNRLFDLFGNGMGKFAIITFTKLDDLEREQTTIEEYIETAPQKLKDFLNRCQGRYIAIDNKASEKKKAAKVNNLIQLVDAIVNKNGGKCYTNEMYREAEAALQRKIKEVEEEKAREKKKEIDQIQSKFTHQIDFIKKDNRKLAKVVSTNKFVQRSFRTAKEKAQQETNRIKDEMKMIDKKRNEEIYFIKKKEKEENEKLARDLEQKERQNMQLLQNLQQQQAETNRRYQEMERQKELQLSKVTEDHNKRMEAEIQWIVDGSNEKYKNMMQALEAKDKGYEKLQQQMAQQNLKMQEIMREKDKEFLKQQDENRKRMELEKDRSNETLRDQLDEQKRSLDATRDILLQEQKVRDQRQREEYQELKRQYERTQEQMKSKGCMQS